MRPSRPPSHSKALKIYTIIGCCDLIFDFSQGLKWNVTASRADFAVAKSTFCASPMRKPAASAAADRHVVPVCLARVQLTRPADLLLRIVKHLLPPRNPADGAGHGEEDGEHRDREAHRLQRDARIEVDVGVELLLDEVGVGERDVL